MKLELWSHDNSLVIVTDSAGAPPLYAKHQRPSLKCTISETSDGIPRISCQDLLGVDVDHIAVTGRRLATIDISSQLTSLEYMPDWYSSKRMAAVKLVRSDLDYVSIGGATLEDLYVAVLERLGDLGATLE